MVRTGTSYNTEMRLPVAALVLLASSAFALEGPPALDWTVEGPVLDDFEVGVRAGGEAGAGRSFPGGSGAENFQASPYVVAPLALRYGLGRRWEAFAVFTFDWGEAPYRGAYEDNGAVVAVAGTAGGADLGDPALGARGAPGAGGEWILGTAGIAPQGWAARRSMRFHQRGAFGAPKLPFGDGAWKVQATVERRWIGEDVRMDSLASALIRFPVDAGGFALGYGSSIVVQQAPTLLLRARPEWRIGERWWAGTSVEGC
ncbi:MAG: hypothetical protein AAB368_05630, partial [bacterium]